MPKAEATAPLAEGLLSHQTDAQASAPPAQSPDFLGAQAVAVVPAAIQAERSVDQVQEIFRKFEKNPEIQSRFRSAGSKRQYRLKNGFIVLGAALVIGAIALFFPVVATLITSAWAVNIITIQAFTGVGGLLCFAGAWKRSRLIEKQYQEAREAAEEMINQGVVIKEFLDNAASTSLITPEEQRTNQSEDTAVIGMFKRTALLRNRLLSGLEDESVLDKIGSALDKVSAGQEGALEVLTEALAMANIALTPEAKTDKKFRERDGSIGRDGLQPPLIAPTTNSAQTNGAAGSQQPLMAANGAAIVDAPQTTEPAKADGEARLQPVDSVAAMRMMTSPENR